MSSKIFIKLTLLLLTCEFPKQEYWVRQSPRNSGLGARSDRPRPPPNAGFGCTFVLLPTFFVSVILWQCVGQVAQEVPEASASPPRRAHGASCLGSSLHRLCDFGACTASYSCSEKYSRQHSGLRESLELPGFANGATLSRYCATLARCSTTTAAGVNSAARLRARLAEGRL